MARTKVAAPNRGDFARRISEAWDKAKAHVFDLGRELIAAKEALPHGEFLAMIESDLPFGADTAQTLMRITRDPRFQNAETLSALPSSPTAIDTLRRMPEADFTEALNAGAIHPQMSVADARELVYGSAASDVEADGRAHAEAMEAVHEAAQPVQTRPRSHVDVTEPEDGIIRSYGHLVALLRKRRNDLGYAQLEADEKAGFETGYTGKLEQPNADYGRRAVHESFDVWLGAMKVGLRLVPLDES